MAGEAAIGERCSKRRCGWNLKEIKYFYKYLAKYQPLRGETYIPTPKKASKQKGLPEHKKQRQRVLEVGYFRPLHMIPSSRRKNPISGPGSYSKLSSLNLTGIDFSIRLNQIKKLEKQNPSLAFNVFGWHNGGVRVH